MNPFVLAEHVYLATEPCDMRRGAESLAKMVEAKFGRKAADGSLYVFVSKDAKKLKMLKFDTGGWILYYLKLCEDTFKWKVQDNGIGCIAVDRRALLWLLEGFSLGELKEQKPLTATRLL